jgi:ABC-2 type transport system ATP-binding protein
MPQDSKAEDNAPAIRIEKLTKIFRPGVKARPVIAVRELDLRVEPGQVYGLLGPNGSGKSTTLKVLLGLIPPTSGKSYVFETESGLLQSRRAVGFLPENPYFYKYLTGRETLRFFGRICGLRKEYLKERVPELLELVGLQKAADRPLAGYSKGMLQRIGLAQALIQDPRLVVLDEPTAGVDPSGSRDIRDLIVQLRDRGITVLLCSHLLAQVQEVCDRIGILNQGVLVEEGRVEELISVKNQREIRVENVPDDLIEDFKKRVAERADARVLEVRRPQTSLEDLFLRHTQPGQRAPAPAKASGTRPYEEEEPAGAPVKPEDDTQKPSSDHS